VTDRQSDSETDRVRVCGRERTQVNVGVSEFERD
jgi:hypothetical protein